MGRGRRIRAENLLRLGPPPRPRDQARGKENSPTVVAEGPAPSPRRGIDKSRPCLPFLAGVREELGRPREVAVKGCGSTAQQAQSLAEPGVVYIHRILEGRQLPTK